MLKIVARRLYLNKKYLNYLILTLILLAFRFLQTYYLISLLSGIYKISCNLNFIIKFSSSLPYNIEKMDQGINLIKYTTKYDQSIQYYRKFSFRSNLNLCLLGTYIYNLMIHSTKADSLDFNCFVANLLCPFRSNEAKKNLNTIIKGCMDSRSVAKRLENCIEYINKWLSSTENLCDIMNSVYTAISESDICNSFCKNFDVVIEVFTRNSMPKVYLPEMKGKAMKLKIISIDNEYAMALTEDMINSESSKYQDPIIFDQEIYIKNFNHELSSYYNSNNNSRVPSRVNDDRANILKLNRRYKLDQLKVDEQLKDELKVEYSSFINISDNKNLIKAFALQLRWIMINRLQTKYTKLIIERFLNKLTCNNMRLAKSENLSNINLDDCVTLCEDMLKLANSNLDLKQQFNEIKINDDLDTSFDNIHVLSLIFGVTSVIIYSQGGKYKKTRFCGSKEDFIPVFHFLALEKERNRQKMSVLFTHLTEYIHNFDYDRNKIEPKTPIIQEILNLKALTINQKKDLSYDKTIAFYQCMASLQEKILSQFIQSIRYKLPPYLTIDINEDIQYIKTKKNELKKLNLIDNQYDSFTIMNYSVKDMSTYCHGCQLHPDPEKKSYFSRNGCFYHFICMKKLFESWYEKTQTFNPDFEQNEIDCATCKSKISVIDFLIDEENKSYLNRFKINVQRKAKCCMCKIECFIDRIYFNPDCFHCPTCIGKIYYIRYCTCCKVTRDMVINDSRYLIECQYCKQVTILANFRINPQDYDLRCKKCWIAVGVAHFASGDQNSLAYLIKYIIGNECWIVCANCGIQFFKSLGRYCMTCDNNICINCDTGMNCVCGFALQSIQNEDWLMRLVIN